MQIQTQNRKRAETESWNRTKYTYDDMGNLWGQHLPHPAGTPTRQYRYGHAAGALISVQAHDDGTGADQYFTFQAASQGIEYNDAGGVSLIHYGNGLEQHIEDNSAFLTNRIWVDSGSGTPTLFDTGQYAYDGARNIKQIGNDLYYYDAAGRLTWSQIDSSRYGTLDLDQSYDAYGNMLDQNVVVVTAGPDSPPQDLSFTGRNYSLGNRISDLGFVYDANGRLTDEPAHDGLSAQSYKFTADGWLARVTDGAGKSYQQALYEGNDHRWFRSEWADGSKALVTLRDASGQVVADYEEANAATGLVLQKEYVHANGQLLAINSTCGPRPALALAEPAFDGTNVWFDRTDYVPATGPFTIHIDTVEGQTKTISESSDLPAHFSLLQSDLFPNVTNWVSIETDAACGRTGYSNAVSYSYSTTPESQGGSCLSSVGASRSGFTGSGSDLSVNAQGDCPVGTTYNVYFQINGTGNIVTLNGVQPMSVSSFAISDLPCGSGVGDYWMSPILPGAGGVESTPSPRLSVSLNSCGGGGGGSGGGPGTEPGQPSMNPQYVSADHLGSTRLVTDESGIVISAFKYYPFGHEAEFSGDSVRQKFTGHERDDRVGLDYMMARSYRSALGRFLTSDQDTHSAQSDLPQSWNRYTYCGNSPEILKDPTGNIVELAWHPVAGRYSHLFVVIVPTGKSAKVLGKKPITLSGFPSHWPWPFGKLVKVQGSGGASERDSFDKMSGLILVDPPKGMSSEDFDLAVKKAFDAYKDDKHYSMHLLGDLWGSNSNGFAIGILVNAGLTVDQARMLLATVQRLGGDIIVGTDKPVPDESKNKDSRSDPLFLWNFERNGAWIRRLEAEITERGGSQ